MTIQTRRGISFKNLAKEHLNKDVIEEFYNIKKELIGLQKREEELKDTIKKVMVEKNVGELHNDFMDLYCRQTRRILYPKEKIERFVPPVILEKIRTIHESTVLFAKLKDSPSKP